MEDKINSRLILIGVLSMLLTGAFTIGVFYRAFDRQVRGDVRHVAETVAAAYPHLEAPDELEEFTLEGARITLIDPEGQVLFESDSEKETMANHLDRPEVQEALAEGTGESSRTSDTLGYKTYYYAIRLADGNIVRLAVNARTMYAIYDKAIPAIFIIGLCLVALSVVMSIFLTRSLVRPIVAMAQNIDHIEEHIPYKELAPFAYAIREQQLKKAELEKERQEFTANVSHELKTPLTSISGYAELIETGLAQGADVQNFAARIHHEAGRLIGLIGDIIELSELDAAPPAEQEPQPVDLWPIVENTIDSLFLQAEKLKVKISAQGQSEMVLGDHQQLEELVYNLCDNALRYNKPGGSVCVTLARSPQTIDLKVKDTGIGIPAKYQGRVFERFFRVDKSRSKETGGTGLGLAIVKHIALRHHAKIRLESEEGQGTAITVSFPPLPTLPAEAEARKETTP